MKAKELAEQLLKYPDFNVVFDIETHNDSPEHPWIDWEQYKIYDITVMPDSKKIYLYYKEIDE